MAAAIDAAAGLDLDSVVAGYERGLIPLKDAEPGGCVAPGKPGKFTAGLGDDLALLCTKIAPTIGVDQVEAWISVMVVALSDLPGRVSREAAKRAIHRPMRFLNEVETVIRECAETIEGRHAAALRRLRELRAAILRAAEPPAPVIEDAVSPEITPDLLRATPLAILRLGLAAGHITQADLDAARQAAPC